MKIHRVEKLMRVKPVEPESPLTLVWCGSLQRSSSSVRRCRKEGSFWVPSVPNECEYFTDHAKTIVFA
ncbi:hypothetical protein TNCV_3540261 [Trichonephila clavipes]|nr:hypothetical protein TNCV_3540261 [Trichonephila clavipes]